MSSNVTRARRDGYEDGANGCSFDTGPWKSPQNTAAYKQGFEAGRRALEEKQAELDEEDIWREIVLKPLALNFDAEPEVMEQLIDVIVEVLQNGKKL